MHNHTENTFGYCASLISVKERETFFICKMWSQIEQYILAVLICRDTERTGMDEKWGMTVSMLESDYCQVGEDLPL